MAENIVTNADDVELVVDFHSGPTVRVIAQDFTITVDQTINSISGISQNTPKGLTKGDLEYSFDFTIQGEDTSVMGNVSDEDGDSNPFDMSARKDEDAGDNSASWEYALTTCLAETEEVSGSTGEATEMAVEGMAAGFDKDV